MILSIQALNDTLEQVTSPATHTAAIITLEGGVIAFSSRHDGPDASDRVKTLAALASGLWRQEGYERAMDESTDSVMAARVAAPLDAICELGRIRIVHVRPFLLIVAGHLRIPETTLGIKADLLEQALRGPLSTCGQPEALR